MFITFMNCLFNIILECRRNTVEQYKHFMNVYLQIVIPFTADILLSITLTYVRQKKVNLKKKTCTWLHIK